VRFDNAPAFFNATYSHFGKGAVHIINDAWRGFSDRNLTEAQAKRIATGDVVGLLNAAFTVHARCEATPSPGDSLLNYRVQGAVLHLPPEWRIVISVEAGETSVDLYSPGDELVQIPTDSTELSYRVLAATEHAVQLVAEAQAVQP